MSERPPAAGRAGRDQEYVGRHYATPPPPSLPTPAPPRTPPPKRRGLGCSGLGLLATMGVMAALGFVGVTVADRVATDDAPHEPVTHPWRIGAVATVVDWDDTLVGTITLEEVVVDRPCSTGVEPRNGHFVALRVDVRAAATIPENASLHVNRMMVHLRTADGEVVDDVVGAGYECVGLGEEVRSSWEPGETGSGWVVFDSPTPYGVLVWDAPGHTDTYEIAFP